MNELNKYVDFTQFNKLVMMLKENKVPYELGTIMETKKLYFPDKVNYKGFILCHSGTYGSEQGHLETNNYSEIETAELAFEYIKLKLKKTNVISQKEKDRLKALPLSIDKWKNSPLMHKGHYWVDLNNNKWNDLIFSLKTATELSISLNFCENCIDCQSCEYCINCINATRSNNCINCWNVYEAKDLKDNNH